MRRGREEIRAWRLAFSKWIKGNQSRVSNLSVVSDGVGVCCISPRF